MIDLSDPKFTVFICYKVTYDNHTNLQMNEPINRP